MIWTLRGFGIANAALSQLYLRLAVRGNRNLRRRLDSCPKYFAGNWNAIVHRKPTAA